MKLLPDSIKTFLINRLYEISGIGSILLSLFILVSIFSYSSFDPNIYNLTNYKTINLGGYAGANVSEVLLQLFGYSSVLICIILISWSYKLFFTKNLELFALNFLLLPFTVLSLSLILQFINFKIANGFIAEQIFLIIQTSNIISNQYIYY